MDNEIIIVCFSNVVHVYVSTLLPFHRLVRHYIVTLTMLLCEVLYFCFRAPVDPMGSGEP